MSFGLALQRLPNASSKVLVVCQLAGAQRGDGWFSTADVGLIFETFRVPAPSRIDNEITGLRSKGLLLRRSRKLSWSVTPEGSELVTALMGDIDPAPVLGQLTPAAGTEFGHVLHTVLPPGLAPIRWQAAIQQMLRDYEFDSNVFCMTRFPRDASDSNYLDPVINVIPAARDALAAHDLTLHVVSDRVLDEDLFGNIAAHMWACRYGIALFENRMKRGLNENMIIELGSMVITGRRCALLKDKTIKKLPTDFSGQLYKPVDFDDINDIRGTLHRWAADDLGRGRCPKCPAAGHDRAA